MARKIIKGELSVEGIESIIKQLETYNKRLSEKNELFVKRLAEVGIPIIDSKIAHTKGDSDKRHYTHIEINHFQDYSQARLIVEGQDILFIEFGAGIHYNGAAGSSPHPKGAQYGYTIGSYGKGQGKNDSWTYQADTGEWVRSYGTQATMPVYSASLEIIRRLRDIAKEVFNG